MSFLFFLVIPAFVFPYLMHEPRFTKLFLFSVISLFVIIRRLRKEGYRSALNPFVLFILISLALFLLPASYFCSFESLYFYALMFFMLLSAAFFRLSDFQELSFQKTVVLSSLLISIIGIQNFYGITVLNIAIPQPFDRGSIIATIGNVNYVSNFLASMLPVTLIAFFTIPEKRWKWISFISIIASSVTILWGQTRSVYLGLFVGLSAFFLFVFLIRKHEIFSRNHILGMIVGLSVIFLFFAFPPFVPESKRPLNLAISRTQEVSVAPEESVGSVYRRNFEWQTALEMFKSAPVFGLGFGSYKLLSSDYQVKVSNSNPVYYGYYEKPAEAHSDLLQLLSETGIVGFSLWVLFLIYVLISGIRKILSEKRLIDIAILSGWLVIFIHSFTEFPMHMMPSLMVFGLFSAFLTERRRRVTFPKWISIAILFSALFFCYVSLRIAVSDGFYAIGLIEKNLSAGHYEKALRNINEARFLYDSSSGETPDATFSLYLNNALEVEKQKATEALSLSFYKQYLAFSNSVTSNPDDSFAAFELSTLVRMMERLTPKPPFTLFDFPDFQYTGVSKLREIPPTFPTIGKWVYSLKGEDRETIEYAYRYFKSLCSSLNAPMDPIIYLQIGRVSDDILLTYERLGIEEQSEKAVWFGWLKFGYSKAINLKGMDETDPGSLWDQIDLDYLVALKHYGLDTEENVRPILEHRLKIAQYTLKHVWKFPTKWYNFFKEQLHKEYFTKYPIYRERLTEIFKTYASYYEENKGQFDDIKKNVENLDSRIAIEQRIRTFRLLEEMKYFIADFEKIYLDE